MANAGHTVQHGHGQNKLRRLCSSQCSQNGKLIIILKDPLNHSQLEGDLKMEHVEHETTPQLGPLIVAHLSHHSSFSQRGILMCC